MSHIQIRIDEKTKKSAKKVLDKIGIDMTTAIKIYLKQIVITKGIPFKIITENGLTPEQENEILKSTEEAEKGINVTKAMNKKEAIEYLNSLK
ncbi:type II toxin-antitoxin system RelB/DinJ family antitoxin [Patescibacteria group bacterium]